MNTLKKTNDIEQDEIIKLHKYQLEDIIQNLPDAFLSTIKKAILYY